MKKGHQKSQSEQNLLKDNQQKITPRNKSVLQQRDNKVPYLDTQQIIGIQSQNKHQMKFDPKISNHILYSTGSNIVVYNLLQKEQINYYTNTNKRAFTTISYTSDFKYLVTGEGRCKNPEIMFWDLQQQQLNQNYYKQTYQKPAFTLSGHKLGIQIILFSPKNKYLVSIGDKEDRGLFVWDYEKQIKLTQNKLSKQINSAEFSQNSQYLVTVGNQHVKIWEFEAETGIIIKQEAKQKSGAYILEGKSPNLPPNFVKKDFQDCCFSSDSQQLFLVTKCGLLSMVDLKQKVLLKWMDVKVQNAFQLLINQDNLIIGSANGIIRVFKQSSLEFVGTFKKPPALKEYNIEKGSGYAQSSNPLLKYADCIGLQVNHLGSIVCAVYSDKTVIFWDINNIQKPFIKSSLLNHSDSVNDIDILQCSSSQEATFFVTTSSDKTTRIWNFQDQDTRVGLLKSVKLTGIRRNAYCENLNKIIYQSEDIEHFKYESTRDNAIFEKKQFQDQGLKVKCSSNGQFICIGDLFGSLKVYETSSFQLRKTIESHDQQITCIDFTPKNNLDVSLFATGSKDGLIHIYDVNNYFAIITTLGDHMSEITDLKFVFDKQNKKILLVSCSTNHTIIIRELNKKSQEISAIKENNFSEIYKQENDVFKIVSKTNNKSVKPYQFDCCNKQQQIIIGQDQQIQVIDTNNYKSLKIIETKTKNKKNNLQNLLLRVESTGSFAATYNNDKIIRIRELSTGKVMAKISTVGDITGLQFSYNNCYLMASNTDSCVYIWKLNTEITQKINKKLEQLGELAKQMKNIFAEQNLLQSKEWTIDNFWIEEELKQQLTDFSEMPERESIKQQMEQIQQNVPKWAMTKESIKPEKIMENNSENIPDWARTNFKKQNSRIEAYDEPTTPINQSIGEEQQQQQNPSKCYQPNLKEVKDGHFEIELSSSSSDDLSKSNTTEVNESQYYPPPPPVLFMKKKSSEQQNEIPQRNTISKIYMSKKLEQSNNIGQQNFNSQIENSKDYDFIKNNKNEDFDIGQIQNQMNNVLQNIKIQEQNFMNNPSNINPSFKVPNFELLDSEVLKDFEKSEINPQQKMYSQGQKSLEEQNIDMMMSIKDEDDSMTNLPTIPEQSMVYSQVIENSEFKQDKKQIDQKSILLQSPQSPQQAIYDLPNDEENLKQNQIQKQKIGDEQMPIESMVIESQLIEQNNSNMQFKEDNKNKDKNYDQLQNIKEDIEVIQEQIQEQEQVQDENNKFKNYFIENSNASNNQLFVSEQNDKNNLQQQLDIQSTQNFNENIIQEQFDNNKTINNNSNSKNNNDDDLLMKDSVNSWLEKKQKYVLGQARQESDYDEEQFQEKDLPFNQFEAMLTPPKNNNKIVVLKSDVLENQSQHINDQDNSKNNQQQQFQDKQNWYQTDMLKSENNDLLRMNQTDTQFNYLNNDLEQQYNQVPGSSNSQQQQNLQLSKNQQDNKQYMLQSQGNKQEIIDDDIVFDEDDDLIDDEFPPEPMSQSQNQFQLDEEKKKQLQEQQLKKQNNNHINMPNPIIPQSSITNSSKKQNNSNYSSSNKYENQNIQQNQIMESIVTENINTTGIPDISVSESNNFIQNNNNNQLQQQQQQNQNNNTYISSQNNTLQQSQYIDFQDYQNRLEDSITKIIQEMKKIDVLFEEVNEKKDQTFKQELVETLNSKIQLADLHQSEYKVKDISPQKPQNSTQTFSKEMLKQLLQQFNLTTK